MCSFVGSCMICCQQSYLWIYLCVWVNSGTFVVVVDNSFSVIHATVADLDGIAVEDFSEFVLFREVFVY